MIPIQSLATLVRRGGVYYNIGGSNPVEVLGEACRVLDLPSGVEREGLLRAILEREALMPTAIGRGLAIPHPRSPLLREEGDQRVAVFFLRNPIAYNALDRKPVTTLFLILSSGAKSHLSALAAISHLSQREDFQVFLNTRPSTEDLATWIERAEASW